MRPLKEEDPSLIFDLIKNKDFQSVEELINNKKVSVNLEDRFGNSVIIKLLKAKRYDLVLKLMKRRNWNVNHQNQDGNTFGHILAHDNSISAIQIMEELLKKKKYLPNIKNKFGETALDIAINNNYLCTIFKILEDKRLNSMDISCFRNLFNTTVSNKLYGKYSKINNLETILNDLGNKELDNDLKELIDYINDNIESIKHTIMSDNIVILDSIVNNDLIGDLYGEGIRNL